MHCVSRTEATEEIAETVSTTNYTYYKEFSYGIESNNLLYKAQICEILQASLH